MNISVLILPKFLTWIVSPILLFYYIEQATKIVFRFFSQSCHKKMYHSLSARSVLLRGCIERLTKPTTVYLSAKCMSSSTDNIVKSSYPDIDIPKISLANYLLENVKDHAEKPAVVSVVCFLIFFFF